MRKNIFLTFLCAFIPGAGQMYQGYMKRGLSLISLACLSGILSDLLSGALGLLGVIVWMYSFFDTFNLRAQIGAGTAPDDDYLVHFDWQNTRIRQFIKDGHKLLGWLLILFGVTVFYKKAIMTPLDDLMWNAGQDSPLFRAFYLVMDELPEIVVCVALCVCGVWLVKGNGRALKREDAPEADGQSVQPEMDFCEYGTQLSGRSTLLPLDPHGNPLTDNVIKPEDLPEEGLTLQGQDGEAQAE